MKHSNKMVKNTLAILAAMITFSSGISVEARGVDNIRTVYAPIEIVQEEESIIRQPITRDFDVFQPSNYTYEDLSLSLSKGSYRTMLPYVDTLIKAEELYGVNALYLMCKLGLESGWGKYTSGINNIGGWTTDSGSFMNFDSVEDCILHIAKNLSTRYRESVGGRLEDVCRRYCSDEGYIETLTGIMIDREAAMKEEM